MPRFFLAKRQIQDGRGLITGQELSHLRKALRLVPGDRITVFDDSGWEHEAVIRSLSPEQGEIEILRSYEAERESPLEMILAVALTKGEKMDFVIEKATELGAHRIVPLVSANAVPKVDQSKMIKRSLRWHKIALSAAKQSGRTRIPEIAPLCEFDRFAKESRPHTLKLFFWEKEQDRTLHSVYEKESKVPSVLLAVGPEGGFSLEEARLAQEHGFESVGLGRRILRAETAAVTVMTLAQYLWGDLH
ncbi:MAG TPA: 16S rRNA (uracil(1498)-N(3))-methyltransferase [Candidatus Binatia bacterium]|nr:16S rRNA (uracil(1498)-N(3))-methyltransferase [Candidatus Binatia bacterium]